MSDKSQGKFATDLTRRATGEAKIAARAMEDPDFRERLLTDPKAALAEATGLQLPDSVKLVVHEESADTLHMVIPPAPPEELTDEQLQAVAGGAAFVFGAGMAVMGTIGVAGVTVAAIEKNTTEETSPW